MRKILLSVLILIAANSFAQQDAWVYFNDKPNAGSYLSNPLLMLSQRALDRRTAQGIPLDIKDVPVNLSYIAQVDAATDITVMAQSKWLNALHIRGSIQAISALSQLSFVSQVEFADHSLNTNAAGRTAVPAKTKVIQQVKSVNKVLNTEATFEYGISANQIQMLNGQILHQQDYTASGKIIAILDAGFPGVNTAEPFQRLWDNAKILGGYNFVGRNDNIYSANSHGTMVLSTMGGYKEGQLVGTAPDAFYYLFITEDVAGENPVEESYWVEAAEKADSLGVDVINSSLGYFGYDNTNYSHTYAELNGTTSFVSRGADIAFSRGMVVVVSAGNSGAGANPYISVPADAANVLTIGAVDSSGIYTSFSSIGPTSDGRIKPDVVAQGVAAVVSNPSGQIMTANGTSFSGPIIAGMVASLWQALPDLTNAEIVSYIKQSASYHTNPNNQYGHGIPDFSLALTAAMALPDFKDNQFMVYPNPVNDHLFVATPKGSATAEISLNNLLGQLVLKQTIDKASPIELGQLQSGIYIYKIQSGSFVTTGKLIKK